MGLFFIVTPGGFEPSTNCLRGNCSAIELRSRLFHDRGYLRARYYTPKEMSVNKR